MISTFKTITFIAAGFALFMVYMYMVDAQGRTQTNLTRENNVYLRTVACLLSVTIPERTDDYIRDCYNRAERANKIQVEHYGHQQEQNSGR